jgi:hypothetical protein
MQSKNLVTGLALGIVFIAGCATQNATREPVKRAQRELEIPVIQVREDFRALNNSDARVKIAVSCEGAGSYCTPYASGWTVVVNKTQNIVFNMITDPYVFDNMGIEFADTSYTCTPDSSTQYTCRPNNPSTGYHKYTIRVVGTTTNDPFVFTY